ncbi:hypothetical protein LINGRAHAP2_LOCUS9546, partial [Linum grandiflorum]
LFLISLYKQTPFFFSLPSQIHFNCSTQLFTPDQNPSYIKGHEDDGTWVKEIKDVLNTIKQRAWRCPQRTKGPTLHHQEMCCYAPLLA